MTQSFFSGNVIAHTKMMFDVCLLETKEVPNINFLGQKYHLEHKK